MPPGVSAGERPGPRQLPLGLRATPSSSARRAAQGSAGQRGRRHGIASPAPLPPRCPARSVAPAAGPPLRPELGRRAPVTRKPGLVGGPLPATPRTPGGAWAQPAAPPRPSQGGPRGGAPVIWSPGTHKARGRALLRSRATRRVMTLRGRLCPRRVSSRSRPPGGPAILFTQPAWPAPSGGCGTGTLPAWSISEIRVQQPPTRTPAPRLAGPLKTPLFTRVLPSPGRAGSSSLPPRGRLRAEPLLSAGPAKLEQLLFLTQNHFLLP